MKKIKIFLSLIAILFIAAGVFAKKANKEIVKDHFFAVGYYEFIGSDPSNASQRLADSNYVYAGPNKPDATDACSQGDEVLCGIYTDGNGVNPTIGATGEIHDALQTNQPVEGKVFLHNE